jgi:tetratricopeptide (TPR) repeat protein
MTDNSKEQIKLQKPLRVYPKLEKGEDGNFIGKVSPDMKIETLMGMRTHDAAFGVYTTAISALGKSAEKHATFVSAIFAETEPQDALEAMLISQMTATYVAMTTLSERMSYQDSTDNRLETPDEVWAEEKFKAAKSQVELRNWPEALSFTTKAIAGDEHHSGYELEPHFHFLRGRIREGLIGTDLNLVDLLAAKEDFLNSVRYWPRSETWFRKQALTRAGWCCYCMEEFEEAENHLVAAARIDARVSPGSPRP